MTQTKIKICGIQTLEDIQSVNRAQPDYVGFVFAPGHHHISPALTRELISHLENIQSVGVVVDEPLESLLEMIRISNVDIIQLHGHETKAYIEELRKHCTIPIYKAIRIQDGEDIDLSIRTDVDHILLDSYTKQEVGGSGKAFAWDVLERLDLQNVWIAGGIHINNVKEILAKHPYGIDISSGVEVDGKKNAQKIKEIVDEVRAYA